MAFLQEFFLGFFKALSLHHIKRKMNKVLLLIQTYGLQRIFLVAKQPILESLPLAHPSHRQKGQDLRHTRPIQTAVKTPLGSIVSSTHRNFTCLNHSPSLTQHLRFTSDGIQCSSHKMHITWGQTILIPYSMPPTMCLREKLSYSFSKFIPQARNHHHSVHFSVIN